MESKHVAFTFIPYFTAVSCRSGRVTTRTMFYIIQSFTID